MNCVDYEELWNELLDARLVGPSELERRLEEHAGSCARVERSRLVTRRFARWSGPSDRLPAPRPSRPARLLALMDAAQVRARPRPIRRLVRFAWIPLSTAAALLVIVRLGGTTRPEPIAPSMTVVTPPTPVAFFRPLDSALDEGGAGTIELALEASAPAARIGREVLGDRGAGGDLAPAPAGPVDDDLATPPSDLIQSVGERLTASVKPISGSARHAFGFLLVPPATPPVRKSL